MSEERLVVSDIGRTRIREAGRSVRTSLVAATQVLEAIIHQKKNKQTEPEGSYKVIRSTSWLKTRPSKGEFIKEARADSMSVEMVTSFSLMRSEKVM